MWGIWGESETSGWSCNRGAGNHKRGPLPRRRKSILGKGLDLTFVKKVGVQGKNKDREKKPGPASIEIPKGQAAVYKYSWLKKGRNPGLKGRKKGGDSRGNYSGQEPRVDYVLRRRAKIKEKSAGQARLGWGVRGESWEPTRTRKAWTVGGKRLKFDNKGSCRNRILPPTFRIEGSGGREESHDKKKNFRLLNRNRAVTPGSQTTHKSKLHTSPKTLRGSELEKRLTRS